MTHRLYVVTPVVALAFFLISGVTVSHAQEKKAAEKVAKKAEKTTPAAEKKDNTPPAKSAAAAADTSSVRAAYEAKLNEWKEMLKQLRQLKHDYQTVDEAGMPEILKRWDALMAKADVLLPQLGTAAIKAYQAAPNQDRDLIRFLVKLLQDEVAHDQYEAAVQLADVLINNGCDSREVYAAAGNTYFAVNKFDDALKIIEKGKGMGVAGGDVEMLEKDINDYKKFWPAEQKIRAEEAKKDDLPRVKLTTTKGVIVLELFENEAPETVGNFISLVKSGFYDGLTFHRVLSGFMAQGGCPVGDGTGGPGYTIYDESNKPNARMHFRGSLSMAKTSAPNSGGSQFFITFRPTPQLNNKHTVFGRVIEGMDVVDKLQRRDPDKGPDLPEPDKIIKAEVLRDRGHEYVPHKVQ